MTHSIDFFRDEVRNGFYIPTAIKQAWAETLDVLSAIDDICKKYGIRYYADWGTFLGVVRHGGFIPWDDDLDICMLRDDYDRFRQVADRELPAGFVIHDYSRKEDHWLFLARVVNRGRMCFEDEYLRKHNNFPWLAGVDIFIKDYLYEDEEAENARDKEIMNLIAVADMITSGEMSGEAIGEKIGEINAKYGLNISERNSERDIAVAIYALAERIMARVSPEDTGKVGQIFPWVLKNGLKVAEEKADYESFVRLPFEDTTIPVPASYNKVLTSRYGDYLKIKKVWDGHNYPFFEGQKEEMEKLLGEPLPGFTFDAGMLERPAPDKSASLKTTAKDCLAEFEYLLADAENALAEGRTDELTKALSDCQSLAADLGTLIENIKGENRKTVKEVITSLEDFCDALWSEYQKIEEGEHLDKLEIVRQALANSGEIVRENIIDRKEILFLPIGGTEWKAFEQLYRDAVEMDNADVFVVPLPLMKKDYYGRVEMTEEEIEDATEKKAYPSDVELTNWYSYDIPSHCPETIYIQNPYDGSNPCLTVPSDFYTENLRNYAGSIIYIPIDKTAEFSKEDVNDIYNLKHYVTAPGVVYADVVYVQSENIRQHYIDALTGFAGEDTKEFWESKIVPDAKLFERVAESGDKKKFLYCIGLNEICEKRDVFADALKNRLGILRDAVDKLDITLCLYPADRSEWERYDEETSKKMFEIIDSEIAKGWMDIQSLSPAKADETADAFTAYYGSPSAFVPAFVLKKKPVMIADYSVGTE